MKIIAFLLYIQYCISQQVTATILIISDSVLHGTDSMGIRGYNSPSTFAAFTQNFALLQIIGSFYFAVNFKIF